MADEFDPKDLEFAEMDDFDPSDLDVLDAPILDANQGPAPPEVITRQPVEFIKGMAKSVPATAVGATEALSRGRIEQVPGMEEFKQEYATPTNTAQSAGKIAGDIAQFFTPLGLEGRLAGLAGKVPFLGRVAPKFTQAALEAFPLSAAQSGSLEGGAGAALAGAGIGSAIRGIAGPFVGAAKRVPGAERLGIELPASGKTSSEVVKLLEASSGKGWGGREITNRAAQAKADLDAAVANFANLPDTRENMGKTIGGSFKRAKDAFMAEKDAAYSQFDLKTVDATPNEFISGLEAIIKREGDTAAGSSPLANEARKMMAVFRPPVPEGKVRLYRGEGQAPPGQAFESMFPQSAQRRGSWFTDSLEEARGYGGDIKYIDLSPYDAAQFKRGPMPGAENFSQFNVPDSVRQAAQPLQRPVTADQLDEARKIINRRITQPGDPVAHGNQAVLRSWAQALENDIDRALPPDVAQARNTAKGLFAEGNTRLNSLWGERIHRLAKEERFSEIPRALSGADSSAIEQMRKTLEPEAMEAVKATALADLLTSAKTGQGYSSIKLEKAIDKHGENLQALLTPDEFQRLKDISETSGALAESQRISRGSQTAYLARVIAYIASGGAASRLALGGAAAEYGLGKFLGSSAGQRWLTDGLPSIMAAGSGAGKVTSSALSQFEREQREKKRIDDLFNRQMSEPIGAQ